MDFDMLYPSSFEMNDYLQKARMFLGDRWIEIGDFVITGSKNDCCVQVPDVEQWLDSREYLNDGTEDWAVWGPRMN